MEEKRLCKTLPEELVERIVSMMPFPAIFKAQFISKSWLARFSPVSRQREEEKKQAAAAFQKLVREQATKWSIFFPIYCDKDIFSACDWQRQQWLRFPIPFFLRPMYPNFKSRHSFGIEGTLLYCANKDFETCTFQTFYVANICTQIWKKLPARPTLSRGSSIDSRSCARLSPILVRDTSLETYKLFVLQGYQGGNMFKCCYIQIYESTLDSWSTKKLVEGVARLHRGDEPYGIPVYFNGVIYACTPELTDGHLNNLIYLMTFNIKKGSFEELALPVNRAVGRIGYPVVQLVVCCAKLMIVTSLDPYALYLIGPEDPCALLHVLTVDVHRVKTTAGGSKSSSLYSRHPERVRSMF